MVKVTSQPTEAESALGFSFGVSEIRPVARIDAWMCIYRWICIMQWVTLFIREMWFFDCSCINMQT